MTPTALVDLEALVWNYRFLCEKAGPAEVGGVVKADAYGLGMLPVATALSQAGCKTFFVAHFSEAVALRERLRDATIIVFNGIQEQDYDEAIHLGITPMLNYLGAVESWHRYARQKDAFMPVAIHLDTGMNRLGLTQREQAQLAVRPDLLEGLKIHSWSSHLACSDEFSNPMTTQQRDALVEALRGLPRAPVSLCNSSGLFWGPDYHFDLIRPGLALYGGNPTPHLPNPMRSVLEIQSPILQIRDVDAGMSVGYGADYHAPRNMRVATLALGYADGYFRALGNKGYVMLGDQAVPLVGRISMDLITIDVTDVPASLAHEGAMATIVGPHRTLDQVATEAGTISYEIMTALGNRVVRSYVGTVRAENLTNVHSIVAA